MDKIKIVNMVRDENKPITYLFRDGRNKNEVFYQLPAGFMLAENKKQIIDEMWAEVCLHFYKLRNNGGIK